MKLVMEFTEGDCECSCDYTIPIEYESAEALICDFMDCVKDSVKNKKYGFTFCYTEFTANTFYFYDKHEVYQEFPPQIYSLDEWFDRKKIMKVI